MPNTITSIKRLIGTKFREEGVQAELATCNFTAVEGPNGETAVEVRPLPRVRAASALSQR